MAEILKENFGNAEPVANPEGVQYGEGVIDFEKARELQQRLGETALNAMEATDGSTVFQLPQPVEQVKPAGAENNVIEMPKPAEQSVGEQMMNMMRESAAKAETVATPEAEKTGLAAETDRTGGAAYSQETLARLAQAGVTESPVEAARQEALVLARQESYGNAQAEIEGILKGRSVEQALADINNDIIKLRSEIAQMEQKTYLESSMQEMQERMLAEARAELAEMERKQAILNGGRAIELPAPAGTVALPAPGESVQTFDEMAEVEPVNEAEAAELVDMMSPEARTNWQMRRARYEAVARELGDATILERLQAIEAQELAQMRENGFVAPEGGMPEEMVEVAETEVTPESGEQELSAEQRESLRNRVLEKLKGRGGWKKFARQVKAAVAAVIVSVAMLSGVVAGATTVAAAAGNDGAVGVNEASRAAFTQMINEQAPMTLNGVMLNAEDVGDVTRDLRMEQADGTKYDYFEFNSDQKHGKNNFGTDKSEFYGDREGTASALLEICRNQPETLAATVSAYPSILEACGLDGNLTAKQIDDLLSNGDKGGEIQQKLLEALEAKLMDEGTQFDFYQEYDQEKSYYMYNMKPGDPPQTPATMGLQAVLTQRHGEKQVKIAVPVLDANGNVVRYEAGDFNMPCGFQLNIEYVPQGTPTRETMPPVYNPGSPETPAPGTPVAPTPETPVPIVPETPVETPETPVETPETPTETPETPTPETPKPSEPTPETPKPSEPEPEPEKPTETVKLKDAENEIRKVENSGQKTEIEQTENVRNERPIETETSVTTPEGSDQAVADQARPGLGTSAEEQAAASAAQQEANRNEITAEPTNDEFANMVNTILNESSTSSSATGTETVQTGGGAGEAQ